MLRIGIDGSALQQARTGIGRYVYELCRELDKVVDDAMFFVYGRSSMQMPIESERWIARLDSTGCATRLPRIAWLKFRCGTLCKSDNLDVFWAGTTLLPGLPRQVRTVATVYDLNHKVVPSTMSLVNLWGHRLYFDRDVRRADIVLTISEGTSARLWELVHRRADGVVRPSIDPKYRPVTDQELQSCLARFGIRYPYILAVATWEPRKNLALLVQTFITMRHEGLLPEHKLVLCGGRGWKDDRLSALLTGEGGKDVVPLGYVAESYLPCLYSGADVFVFPSIYEGFGMPVLEARACGTQIVTTDLPELREAGGSDAIYIQPTRDGVRGGILSALALDKRAERVDQIVTWADGARILASALISVASNRTVSATER